MAPSDQVETKVIKDAIIEGASDQGVGFFFNTFKKGRRTKSAIAPKNALNHDDAFVSKIRPSTAADLWHVSPAWQGMSFYEKNTDILRTHLEHLRRNEDTQREQNQSTLRENLRHRSMKYKKQRALFQKQRDRNKERTPSTMNSPLVIQAAPRIELPPRPTQRAPNNEASSSQEGLECIKALHAFDRKLESSLTARLADFT